MNRQKISAVAIGLSLLAAACSDDTSAPATTDTAAVTTTAAPTTDAAPDTTAAAADPTHLRGVKYCEVLLVTQEATGLVANVWNSMGHSVCPDADWAELDAAAIAKERGAMAAVLNGPRYWTLDEIQSTMQIDAPVSTFGTIEMFLAATVDLGPGIPDRSPYKEAAVARDTVFVFHGGSEVYLLTAPDGTVYVMQSYSQIKDPTMSADRLPTLGSELQLPEGWTFSAETLTDQLEVTSTDGIATVIQDEFQNTYQRVDAPPI